MNRQRGEVGLMKPSGVIKQGDQFPSDRFYIDNKRRRVKNPDREIEE
jgi:hypothetical protein